MKNKKILITGAAGFIGFHTAKKALEDGHTVIGIDNLNDYYDVNLKHARLSQLEAHDNFLFLNECLSNKDAINQFLSEHQDIDYIIHLAAQAGVRYSLQNPFAYVQSNLAGHVTMLEVARHLPHLARMVYASSSSVYGGNTKIPFAESDPTDNPVSLYAATKKSNELLSQSYHNLYDIPLTGLRFFTVYGPWGRPDMAYFSFTKKILADEEIQIFNYGDVERDFTYIDDIVDGILAAAFAELGKKPEHKVYNLGNNQPVKVPYFVELIEKSLGKTARKELLPMQPGDVHITYADIDKAIKELNYQPSTTIEEGISKFVQWYQSYYQ